MMFPKKELDLSQYETDDVSKLDAKYGLPKEVKFCKRCIISNQRPSSTVEYKHKNNSKKQTINFDEEGICDACRVAEIKKQEINWEDREQQLQEICDRHRSKDGSFDCVVPGSGGKDSFYASHLLKYKYGMNPLTVTWAPHIYTDWGWKNFQAWLHAGFDNILYTPNGRVHRLLTRLAVESIYHPFQPFFLGQKSVSPKLAIEKDIKLVFYGENEAEYGNPIASYETAKQSYDYFTADRENAYISGVSVHDLKSEFGLKEADLDMYMPADPQKIHDKDIEVHYMGYYTKWHPQSCYYYSVEHGGFQASPERTPGTYSKYSSIDDKIDDLHYFTTFIKFGIGRATYDAAQEIRSGDITREEGVALAKKFDGEFPERFIKELYEYLTIDEKSFGKKIMGLFENPKMDHEYFMHLTDCARSPHLWKRENGEWKRRYTQWDS